MSSCSIEILSEIKNPLRFAGDFFIKFHDDVINFTVGRIDKMDFKKIFSMMIAAMILFTASNGLAKVGG